ncbi:nucleotide exchange factor GrpE [candidate division TA06 bacterium]|nr:nucleotide exchange factor GrpE [candidate division TA06 bacterium]
MEDKQRKEAIAKESESEQEILFPQKPADEEKNATEPAKKPKNMGVTARLREELEKTKTEVKENYDKYLRAMADLDNYRKRVRKETGEVTQSAKRGLILDILPVLDNFKRALNSDHFSKEDNFHRGIEMIYHQFMGVLVEEGLREVKALGEPFDPAIHEAVTTEVSQDHPPDTVIEELETGYLLGEKLIRPARVKVTKSPEKTTPEDTETTETIQSKNVDES